MIKYIKRKLGLTVAFTMLLAGCTSNSADLYKPDKSDRFEYRIEEYSISDIAIDDRLTTIYEARKNDETGLFEVYGEVYDYGAELCEKRTSDNSEISKKSVGLDYVYEPFRYFNGNFWGSGLKSDGSQKDNYSDELSVISLYIADDGTEYRLLMYNDSGNYAIDVRNSDNTVKYTGNIVNIPEIKKITEDSEYSFFNDINVYGNKIYLAGEFMNLVGDSKESFPVIAVLDSNDYSCSDIISQIDLPCIDKIYISQTGNMILKYYDSTNYKTYLYSLTDNIKNEIDGKIDVLSYAKDTVVYTDLNGKVFEYDLKSDDIVNVDELPEFNDTSNITLIDYNSDSYVLLNENYISDNRVFVVSENGALQECDFPEDVFILKKDDDLWYIENLVNQQRILLEDSFFSDEVQMYYDNKYYYVKDVADNILYAYDHYGKQCFCVDRRSSASVSCFGNGSESFIAELGTDKTWILNQIDSETNDVTKVCDINKYIDVYALTEFCNGDSKFEFYIFNKGILYGYSEEKMFTPLINLSAVDFNGDITGINIDDENKTIDIVTTWGIKHFEHRDANSDDIKELTIYIPDDYVIKEIVERYNAEHDNIHFIFASDVYNVKEQTIPDIIIADRNTDIIQLLKMNVFENLNEMITNDKIGITDGFVESVVRAYEINDELFAFPLSFYIRGLDIKTDQKINSENFEIKDLKMILENADYGVANLADLFILDGNKEFIDINKANVDYNNTDFLCLLELYRKYNINDYQYCISDSLTPDSFRINYMNNKSVFTGIPSSKGNKMYIQSDKLFLISKNSEYKDECTAFLNLLLTDKMQSELSTSAFPVNLKIYRKIMDDIATETSEEYVKKIDDIMDGNLESYIPDGRIKAIVTNSLFSYENGEITAEETAEVLNKKVKMYLNESL